MFPRNVFLIIRRNAGHSKWQNIKHTKAEKDVQRANLFIKLCQKMKVAIHENGNNPNPFSNLQLAQAIELAKKSSMPVSSIEACIKSTQGNQDGAKPFRYAIKGPKGSILLVTALTTSQRKTKQELCHYIKKVGGIMSEQSLEGNFTKKGIIIAEPPSGVANIEETSIDHAIEAGAEEVLPVDDSNKLSFSCEVTDLHTVKSKLEEFKYAIEHSRITFIPKIAVRLEDSEMELMSKILAKVEEHPEVVEIHDNIA